MTLLSIDPPQADYSNLAYDFLSSSVAWVYLFVRDANNPGGTTKYYRTTTGGQLWLSSINQGNILMIEGRNTQRRSDP